MQDGEGDSVIKHVDCFNQQILFITQERPFPTPAVFIDFPRIEWKYLSHGVRESDVQFNLYIVVDSITERYSDTIEVFDIHDKITAALWNWNRTGEIAGSQPIGTITLLSSTTDNEFDELRADIDTYVCHVIDYSTKTTTEQTKMTIKRVDVESTQ